MQFPWEETTLSAKSIKEIVRKRTEPRDGSGSEPTNRVQTGFGGDASGLPAADHSAPEGPNAQAYVLGLPAGSLVYSGIVAHHRLWGHTKRSKTLKLITGEIHGNAHNPFETRAALIASALLTDCDGGRGTLLSHTLLGFFARAMHEDLEAGVLTVLLQGEKTVASKYFKSAKDGALTSPNLKWCKACASVDLSDVGMTHWYAMHQLPFVTHCHRHYQSLIYSCEACGTRPDDGRRWMLPGDGCNCIRQDSYLSKQVKAELLQNDPYRQLLDDVGKVFEGLLPEFRPSSWRLHVRAFIERIGSLEQANSEVVSEIEQSWSASRERNIAQEVSALIKKGGLERELRLLARPRETLLRLVLLRAMSNLLQRAGASSVVEGEIKAAGQVDQLEGCLEELGLPAGVATMLREGDSMLDIARVTSTSTAILARALATLPSAIGDDVSKARVRAGLRRPKVATPFNVPSRLTSDVEKRTILRKKIRYLIDELGMTRRGQITALLGGARAWMLQNDREWLEKNLPRRRGL